MHRKFLPNDSRKFRGILIFFHPFLWAHNYLLSSGKEMERDFSKSKKGRVAIGSGWRERAIIARFTHEIASSSPSSKKWNSAVPRREKAKYNRAARRIQRGAPLFRGDCGGERSRAPSSRFRRAFVARSERLVAGGRGDYDLQRQWVRLYLLRYVLVA